MKTNLATLLLSSIVLPKGKLSASTLHEKSSHVRDTRTQPCEGTSINSWLQERKTGCVEEEVLIATTTTVMILFTLNQEAA
jgi:hypothetical protein